MNAVGDGFDITLEDDTLRRADLEDHSDAGRRLKLIGCDLAGQDLSRMAFDNWHFERCDMTRTGFTCSECEDAQFLSCRAAGASFDSADLSGATIQDGDFNNASFRRATLQHARLSRVKMTGVDLTEAEIIGLSVEDILFGLAKLPRLSFRKAVLKGIDFSDADLPACDFSGATFRGCSLRDANIKDCRFDKADLRGADLGGIKITDARQFKGAVISTAQATELLRQIGLHIA